MDEAIVLDIFKQAIYNILLFSAPMLLGALSMGLIIAIFQATTQIQEQTLAFVPKVLVVFLTIIFIGPWLLSSLVEFTESIFGYMDIITR